jgi:hypothetical protein
MVLTTAEQAGRSPSEQDQKDQTCLELIGGREVEELL